MVLHLERFKYRNENYYRDFYEYESYVKGLIMPVNTCLFSIEIL